MENAVQLLHDRSERIRRLRPAVEKKKRRRADRAPIHDTDGQVADCDIAMTEKGCRPSRRI